MIIAEIGINHNGSVELAKRLIDVAVLAGCDYVKFQKRNPEKCVPEKQKGKIKDTPWGEMSYIDYKNKIEFNESQYNEIDTYCTEKQISWFASVWDKDSAKFMTKYTDLVKIPSAKIFDECLLRYCRKHFKYVIMSTGMSEECEVERAVKIGNPDVIMHTNSTYPSKIKELNLKYILWLKYKYPSLDIGYSGHEYGLTTTFAAYSMGAKWIERHITIDRTMWGSDQMASIEPIGLIKLAKGLRDIDDSMGVYAERILWESEKKKRSELS